MDHEDRNDNLSRQTFLKEKTLYESIMKMMPFGTVLIGEQKDIEYHNDKFSEIFAGRHLKFPNLSDWLNTTFPEDDYRKQLHGILYLKYPLHKQAGKDITQQP